MGSAWKNAVDEVVPNFVPHLFGEGPSRFGCRLDYLPEAWLWARYLHPDSLSSLKAEFLHSCTCDFLARRQCLASVINHAARKCLYGKVRHFLDLFIPSKWVISLGMLKRSCPASCRLVSNATDIIRQCGRLPLGIGLEPRWAEILCRPEQVRKTPAMVRFHEPP
jgi:hypothetical protein